MKRWKNRGEAKWLPGSPDARIPERVAKELPQRPYRFDPGRPPEGLVVTPGDPDGWRIALTVRAPRGWSVRLLVGAVLAVATAVALAVEPATAVLPVFGLLALGTTVVFEETGPDRDRDDTLEVGSTGVRCGDVKVPAAQIRDVFWRPGLAGEVVLGVRDANGEVDVARVATAPAHATGLTEEQRTWVAEAVRAVGRANRERSGTAKDVPAALKDQLERGS
ncbi:MAG: hypothetical protein R3F61_17840 [Myxococcota bacterium]